MVSFKSLTFIRSLTFCSLEIFFLNFEVVNNNIRICSKKSPKTKQFNLFSSPSGLMCEREGRMYDDESAWHNKFYKEVTSKVDEDILNRSIQQSVLIIVSVVQMLLSAFLSQ